MELNIANVGMLVTLASLLVGVLSYNLAKKKDDTKEIKDDTTTQTELKMQLEYISRGIDDIKLEIRDVKSDAKQQDKNINTIFQEIARLQESEKSAHKRITELEQRINELERK